MTGFYSKDKHKYYRFDEETERIYEDDVLLPSYEVEPIFMGSGEFAGIHFKGSTTIITKNGNTIVLTSEGEIG